jgi:NAD-dependent deacetylase
MAINLDHDIAAAAALLRPARRVGVLSGAGLSKASGVPTYRGAGGLWTQGGASQFSHIDGFERDPEGFLQFWTARVQALADVKPNPGHHALVQLQSLKPETALITQNVDGLLTEAGAQKVIELHGSLMRWRCSQCGRSSPMLVRECGFCGGLCRPAVVMFGEMLNADTLAEANRAAKSAEVFITVGTTAEVFPAAELPLLAQRAGARLVTINPEDTVLDEHSDVVIRGPSEVVLPQLVAALHR